MHGGIWDILHRHPGADPLFAAFAFLLLFGFTLPIPEELALVLVGLTLRGARRGYFEVLPVALLALALSDLIFYSIARLFGSRLHRFRLLRTILKPERINEAERYFLRRGPRIVFTCRFVVGLRLSAIMSAGFLRLSLKSFLAHNLPALCIGASAWLGIGYSLALRLGSDVGNLGKVFSVVGPVAALVAALLVYRSVVADRSAFLSDPAVRSRP